MARKFIFFLVLVSVTQNSVLLSSAFDGLSEEALASLEVTASEYLDAAHKTEDTLKLFYNKLDDLSGQISETDSASILDHLGEVVDIIVNSVSLLGKESCASIITSDTGPRAIFNEAFAQIFEASKLAGAENNSDSEAKIAEYQKITLAGYRKLVQALFDIIRKCAGDVRENAQALIQKVQDKVDDDLVEKINTIYESLESIRSRTTRDPNALANIIRAVLSSQKRTYALYETIYIDNCLNHTDIVEGVYQIQHARYQVAENVKKGTNTTFEVTSEIISKYLTAPKGSSPDFNTYNFKALEEKRFNYYLTGCQVHLKALLATQPSSSDEITEAESRLPESLQLWNSRYWAAITSITNNQSQGCADILSTIDDIESIQNGEIRTQYENLLAPVRNNADISAQSESKISEIENDGVACVQKENYYIFEGIKLAAKISCSNESSDTDYSTKLQEFQKQGVAQSGKASVFLEYASLFRFLANNGY